MKLTAAITRRSEVTLLALFVVGIVGPSGLAHAQALGDLTQTQKIWGGSGGGQFGESLAAQGRRAALGGGSIGYYPWDPVLDFTSGSSSANSVHPPPLSVAVGRVAWAVSSGVYIAAWLDGGYPVFPAADFISVSSAGALAMDGPRIALGIPGEDRVEVWLQDGNGDWGFEREFQGTVPGRGFGFAVDLSGNVLAIGVPGYSSGVTGRVELWQRFLNNWVLLGSVTAPGNETDNAFGSAVAVAGTWLAAGAPLEDTEFPQTIMVDPGAVYLYQQESYLGNYQHRVSLFGEDDGDRFGTSLDLDDLTLVVGAPNADVGAFPFVRTDAGKAYVYWRRGDLWSYAAALVATDASDDDALGSSSAIFAGGVLVGAPSAKGGPSNDLEDAGGVYFYRGLNPFFFDGFESGDTSAWSTSVP